MSKVENIFLLSRRTTAALANGEWPDFLKTAAWAFKYSFPNQVLIYAQQPDAKACATVEIWNNMLLRSRVPNAAAIALLEDGDDYMQIKYVYDVSQTYSPSGQEFKLWSFAPEKEADVRAALISAYYPALEGFDSAKVPMGDLFKLIAHRMVSNQSAASVDDLISIRDEIEGLGSLTNTEIAQRFQNLLADSIAAVMMYRCGLNPEFEPEAFSDAALFGSYEVMAILGQTMQSLSKQGLNIIAKTVQSWDRTHKEEQKHEHEGELSQSRGMESPGAGDSGTAEVKSLQQDAEGIPSGAKAEQVHSSDVDRRVDGALSISGQADREDDRGDHDSAFGSKAGSEQGSEQSEMDTAHDDASSAGGGDGPSSNDLLLNDEEPELLPDASAAGLEVDLISSAEEAAVIEAASTGSSLTQDEIDSILTDFSLNGVSYEKLAGIYQDNPDSETAITTLRDVYEGLTFVHLFSDGSEAEISGKVYGFHVAKGDEVSVVGWEKLSERLRYLAENGRYMAPGFEAPPVSSSELIVGQVFLLRGMKYQMVAESEETVTLQDVEHPIFTQILKRSVLDKLLGSELRIQNSAQQVNREEEATSSGESNTAEIKGDTNERLVKDASDDAGQERDLPEPKYNLISAKRNFAFLNEYAPEIINNTLDYIRFESEAFEPLYIERIDKDLIAIAHTYIQNGDIMLDPEIVFCVDAERSALFPISFQQSSPPVYQMVYGYDDTDHLNPNHQAEKDLNSFFSTWSQNLNWQKHTPVRGVKYDNSKGDIEYTFTENRELVSELLPLENYINTVLLRGSGFENGKRRIYEQFQKNQGKAANIDFLKHEYGIGGGTVDLSSGVFQKHDSKGIELYRGEDRLLVKWGQVETLINELIRDGLYLNEEEKRQYTAEPYIDHPELVRRDLSRSGRIDKVVLADLLIHFENYRVSYALQMPELNEQDQSAYDQEYEEIQNIVVSDDASDNLARTEAVVSFFNRWFLPFADDVAERIKEDLDKCLDAASDLRKLSVEEILDTDSRKDFSIDEAISVEPSEQFQEEIQDEPQEQVEHEPSLFDFEFVPEEDTASETQVSPAAVPVIAAPNAEPSKRNNFHITEIYPNYGGPKARFDLNVKAIRLLKDLEAEARLASPDEQEVLSKYVGWGGLAEAFDPNNERWRQEYSLLKELLTEEEYNSARESTLNAFYTPPVVTEAIYKALQQLGFRRGNILDPCCGTGNFFGMLPEEMQSSKLYGVELDSISGRISRQLYQNANIIIDGYEKTSFPDSIYDVVLGNVPFGNYSVSDRRYDKEHFLIHDYFFAKSLDKVRPGGIIAFITSKGTMDKQNESVRRYIAQRADLLGAVRLPDNVFHENAGTDTVADILFLRKREQPSIEVPYWVDLDRVWQEDGTWGPEINAYFADNPDMILGDMVEVSGPHGPVYTCKAREDEDLRELLADAVSKIDGEIGDTSIDFDSLESEEAIPADPNVRNFSYTVVNGDVYFRENSVMQRMQLNKTAEKRVKGMVELRNITRELIDAQLSNLSDSEINALQRKLGEAYDDFTAKYGIINSRANSMAFSDDSSYYLLCSLENLDKEGNFLGKADMFYKRTIGHHEEITHVETAKEALGVSIGELGRIDFEYMSQLSNISREDLIKDLEGIIFPVPGREKHYELSNIYLSGNVRKKLLEAQKVLEEDPGFAVNVEKLEEALPEDLSPDLISVRLGSTWVPPEDYENFMYELFDLPDFYRRYNSVRIAYSELTDRWSVVGKNNPYGGKVDSEYGTKRMNGPQILEHTLNLRDVQIFDTVETDDGREKRVLNVNETIAAQEKQQLIKDAFQKWIWEDPERRDRLCEEYNKRFNSIVPPSYDGNMVQFHGLNPYIRLDEHQKEGVARILYGGNTLLAHVVGAGKTWTMVAAAMEAKYLGLCNKSMVVVPNHLIGQWAAAIYSAYPQANVLVASKKDFEPANRKKFCSRIATGDYDIVVIGHSQFERVPLSTERQKAILVEQRNDIIASINELKESKGEHFTIKELERAKKNLETRIEKLQNGKKRDDVVTFEELGIDRLFIDESHEYKNLFLYSKMHNVAGISQTDSQKASDLFMKCRYMDEVTDNMGNIHATGSPVSNTMAEVYTTQRYLQYDALQEMGLGSFDAWASTFGETVVSLELAPEGNGYRPRTRFAKFFNLPELMNMYKQVADIRTKDMLNLPLPTVEYETVALKPSEEQQEAVRGLGDRADRIRRGGVNSKEDNMLCITNDGRKLALDQRLIDPDLPDNPNSKAVACADKIYELYCKGEDKKLTQLVFCDISTPKNDGSFNVYDDLKEKLMQRGIPAEEIRYIHEANTEAQKEALFDKVRAGDVRVLMGSTGKMGTGTNVQNLLIAGHDLDCPWRPSDLEQRAGRVERRGNENDKVYMFRYVTEGTFDAYMYQLLEAKQRFISQIFTSKDPARIANDVDDATLSFSEIKALATGNPKIKEKVALEIEVSKLEMLCKRHEAEQFKLDKLIRHTLPSELQKDTSLLLQLKKDAETASANPYRDDEGHLIPINIKGMYYDTPGEAGNALLKELSKISKLDTWVTLGSFRGFEIKGIARLGAFRNSNGEFPKNLCVAIAGDRIYEQKSSISDSGSGIIVRLNSILEKYIPNSIKTTEANIEYLQRELDNAKSRYGKPFASAKELEEKKTMLARLDEELNIDSQREETEIIDRDAAEKIPEKPSLSTMISSAEGLLRSHAAYSQVQQGRTIPSRA